MATMNHVGETFSGDACRVTAGGDWGLVWRAATVGMAQAIQSRDWPSKRAFYAIRKQAKGFMETPEDKLLKAIFGTVQEEIPAVPERYQALIMAGKDVSYGSIKEANALINADYKTFKEAQKGLNR